MNDGSILIRLLNIIMEKISEFSGFFIDLALGILLLLLVIEIIRSAVDLVSGSGFNIGMKFITYIAFLVVLVRFPAIYEGINRGLTGDAGLKENFSVLSRYVNTRHQSNVLGANPRGVHFYVRFFTGIDTSKFDPDYVLRVIFTSMSHLLCFGLLIFIIYKITEKYAVLLMLLSMGPVPLSLMMSPDTRSVGLTWIKSVLSKFLTLFIYSEVLRISHRVILKLQYDIFDSAGGEAGLISNLVPALFLLLMILFLFGMTSSMASDLVN